MPCSEGQEPLDGLYMTILTSALENSDPRMPEALNAMLALQTILGTKYPMSLDTLAGFLRLDNGDQVLPLLAPLLPVLHISETGSAVFIFHQSFQAFMSDPQRSGIFYCNDLDQNRILARLCFNTMGDMLQFNICERELSYALDRDIPGLFEQAQQIIPPELMYAWLYWGSHVDSSSSAPSDSLFSQIDYFLSNHLLSWMEVLNLQKCLHRGVLALSQVAIWLQASKPFPVPNCQMLMCLIDYCRNIGLRKKPMTLHRMHRSSPHHLRRVQPRGTRPTYIYLHCQNGQWTAPCQNVTRRESKISYKCLDSQ